MNGMDYDLPDREEIACALDVLEVRLARHGQYDEAADINSAKCLLRAADEEIAHLRAVIAAGSDTVERLVRGHSQSLSDWGEIRKELATRAAEIARLTAKVEELEKAIVFAMRSGAYLTQKGDEIYYDTGPITGEWVRTVGTDSDMIRVLIDAARAQEPTDGGSE